jgi:hypothetical protein
MEQIIKFAKAHGFHAEQSGREVVIEIPGWHQITGEAVTVCERVRTMNEARDALGY